MKIKRISWEKAFKLSIEHFIYTFFILAIGLVVILVGLDIGGGPAYVGLFLGSMIIALGETAVLIKIASEILFFSFESSNPTQIQPIQNVVISSRSADPNSNNTTVNCRYCGVANSPSNRYCKGCNQDLKFRQTSVPPQPPDFYR